MCVQSKSTHTCWAKTMLDFNAVVTSAKVIDAYSDTSFTFSHSKNLRPSLVTGMRPKLQYAAVSRYFSSRSANDNAIAPGRQSNPLKEVVLPASSM